MKHSYLVKSLNINDVEVPQKIVAKSADEAAQIVQAKNKYLRVQSVENIDPKPQHFEG